MSDYKNFNWDQRSRSSGLSGAWNTGRYKQQNLRFFYSVSNCLKTGLQWLTSHVALTVIICHVTVKYLTWWWVLRSYKCEQLG